MKLRNALLTSALAMVAITGPALAQSQGDWTLGVGVGYLHPKSDNGTVAGTELNVGNDTRPIFTAEYFVRDNLGVELLAATPFEHDLSLSGVGKIGSTKHLPPTLSLNYHFPTQSKFTPYVGAGINYTIFFDEDSALGDLSIENSWGLALQAGVDYQISDAGSMRLNVRWFDIDSDVKLDGTKIGKAEIDPWLVGLTYVHRF
ncbi:outer membrane beta-barrel protein [Ruegeria sp. 2012CJ41-6]|uniref:Outer membrane beta-barrel protein n=1 Tax=Ruegeria spongiae TaxID=2942209 RepID=A0ABT0Q2G7_9RHOB|nr:OmpW family outer membrane protein [Ruegeria spongiae]MCL6283998.1 outer membrane beta-barrel protein [Ruegeria spongiae]